MSNLSDLLPSGGGQNIVDFTASGTIASGKPVALNSNGTVSQVAGVTESLGDAQTVVADSLEQNAVAYDSTNNRIVIAAKNGDQSNAGYAYVGTVSGSTISFGTGVQFESGSTETPAIVFDSTNGKVVIVYRDAGNSSYGTAIVGTVSGTSISFGSAVVFNSSQTTNINAAFDSGNGKVVIAYKDHGNSNYGTGIVGTVSGTSISFGSEAVFVTETAQSNATVYDSTAQKVVIAFQNNGASNYGQAVVGTVSGTSISFSSPTTFNAGTTTEIDAAYDSTNNRIVIAYKDGSNSNYGTSIVGTVSGTDISFGTEVIFDNGGEITKNKTVFDVVAAKVVVHYSKWDGATATVNYVVGTVSGTSISFDTPVVLSGFLSGQTGLTYDSTAEKVIIAYRGTSSPYGLARTLQLASTNVSDFIGLADAAISDTATGKVNVKGSINSKQSSLTIGSDYYVQSDGSISTTSTSPAVKIGQAVTATTINMMDLT